MTTNSPNPVDGDVQAQPVAWAHRLVNKRNGTIHPWVYGSSEKEPSEGDLFRIEVKPLYDTPPAQPLRPVDLSECKKLWYDHDDLSAEIVCIPLKEIKKALRQQGYEVKND